MMTDWILQSGFDGNELLAQPVRATETVGNALEAESYSKASSATFISLFPISITSLYIERETGIEPATSSLGRCTSRKDRSCCSISVNEHGGLDGLNRVLTLVQRGDRVHFEIHAQPVAELIRDEF